MTDAAAYRRAIFTAHERHERITALREIAANLDHKEFWRLFHDVWSDADSLFAHQIAIRDMLTSERLEAPERLDTLPAGAGDYLKRSARRNKPIKIYRGARDENLTGFSWSSKNGTAQVWANHSGSTEASIVVGRVQSWHVIAYYPRDNEIVALPENVSIEKVVSHPVRVDEDTLNDIRVRNTVLAYGAARLLNMSLADYFLHSIEDARMERDKIIDFVTSSLEYLEPLGFRTRVEILKEVLKKLEE